MIKILEFQRRLTWPTQNDCQRLNEIIYETTINPFGIASYNPNEPVTDFVGRREELHKLREQIQIVLNNKISRSVKFRGPAGVGKSTLFNYLKESIEKERIDREPTTDYILKDCDILSTYFQIPDKISEFYDIWKPMVEGLTPGFESETGHDISLPEYIAFQIIYRLFLNDKKNLAKIIWTDEERPARLHQVEFNDIIDPLYSKGESGVQSIQQYYRLNKRQIREELKSEVKGRTYEIKRADNNKIINLFRVINEDDPEDYLGLILDGNSRLFRTNDDLIAYFNDIMRYYACSTKKQPILLIGIDEAVKADPQFYEEYYIKLGNLFVKLRNALNDILFVFISTTEDWAEFDNVINKYTDLQSQLEDYIYDMPLTQMSVEELIQVFKNRMDRFWNNYATQRSLKALYYPFSENLFIYVYRYKLRDLRKTIHFLKEIWIKFRFLRKIPKFETIFECMREVRKFDNRSFDPNELKRFEWKIISNSFNHSTRFRSNSSRSSAVEKGLENAWKCLLYETPPTITKVKNNCIIRTSSGIRKPDIYIETFGNLGAEYRRHIEFQVKAYDKNGTISLHHIASSIKLFEEQFTDIIYFIITGKGLDSNAEAKIRELESTYPNRIRYPVLTEDQKDRLYLLALYAEITGKNLVIDDPDDLLKAKSLLSFIIGQPLENLLADVKNLAYRIPLKEGIIEVPDVPQPPTRIPPQPPITSFGGSRDGGFTETGGEEGVKWVKNYSDLTTYRYEACALCGYLKNREKGQSKFKFTITTVEKNVIIPNISLDKGLFKRLVGHMEENGYIIKDKRSFKLTNKGEVFYYAVKNDNYVC